VGYKLITGKSRKTFAKQDLENDSPEETHRSLSHQLSGPQSIPSEAVSTQPIDFCLGKAHTGMQ
jgi:hypothetical protein